MELPSAIISPSHVVSIHINNIKQVELKPDMNDYFSTETRRKVAGMTFEEMGETLLRISLHLKNATMLTTACWKTKHQHPLDKFEWITGNGFCLGELGEKPPKCIISPVLILCICSFKKQKYLNF